LSILHFLRKKEIDFRKIIQKISYLAKDSKKIVFALEQNCKNNNKKNKKEEENCSFST